MSSSPGVIPFEDYHEDIHKGRVPFGNYHEDIRIYRYAPVKQYAQEIREFFADTDEYKSLITFTVFETLINNQDEALAALFIRLPRVFENGHDLVLISEPLGQESTVAVQHPIQTISVQTLPFNGAPISIQRLPISSFPPMSGQQGVEPPTVHRKGAVIMIIKSRAHLNVAPLKFKDVDGVMKTRSMTDRVQWGVDAEHRKLYDRAVSFVPRLSNPVSPDQLERAVEMVANRLRERLGSQNGRNV